MSTAEIFKQEWAKTESVETYPHHLRNIILIDSNEFIDKVLNASKDEAKELVDSVYSGDAYILQNAVNSDCVEDIKQKVYDWSLSLPSQRVKMLDGCKDYHCINDKPQGPLGGYTTIEHSYVFFRHNKDEFTSTLFNLFDKYWGAIKVLSGNEEDEYHNNIPSDGIIDRITFMQYPYNEGKISKHYDSSKIQKLLLGSLFSQIGEDYDFGENGFYVIDKRGRKIHLENVAQKGDFVCVSPTLYHGVPPVKKRGVEDSDLNWGSLDGRWYLQCYSPESHEVVDRDYTVAIKDESGHGPIANHIK